MSPSSESAAEQLPFDDSHNAVASVDDATQRVQITLASSDAKQSANNAAQAWLDAQCDMISGTTLGLVLDVSSDGDSTQAIACWPYDRLDVPIAMMNAAQQALIEKTVVFVAGEDGDSDVEPDTRIVASPLNLREPTAPVAVFELPNSIRHQQQAIIQIMHWGAVWFNLLQQNNRTATPNSRLATVVEVLAGSLEHTQFDGAVSTVTTQLATLLDCTRVSLGVVKDQSVSVCAISGSANIDTRLNLTRDIAAAMNEAVDQGATLSCPAQVDGLPHVTFAQEALARNKGGDSVMSTPLYDGQNAIGAITIEREGGIDQETRDICESLSVLLGPVIALKYEKELPVIHKLSVACRKKVSKLFGPKELAYKFYALMLLAGLLFFSFAKTDYRITTQARLEGSVKRVITAPQDGFIAKADYRAGDTVESGAVLATLEDRELRLKQLQLNSQREQLNKEHRAALTDHDRSTTAIVSARMQQINAQLALIEEQLMRTQLTAPFAGIGGAGDLSQSIGSPVENGKVLFEIAPLNDYRVVLEVDERDIGDVKKAQSGSLTLTGLPGANHAFLVDRIVPLSKPDEGRNVFEVHAKLDEPLESIRPGMEGIGKIDVERRKLVWVWTHKLIDWLRLSLWTWIS